MLLLAITLCVIHNWQHYNYYSVHATISLGNKHVPKLFKAARTNVCWISKKQILKFLLGEKMVKICKNRGLYYTILADSIERQNQNFRRFPDPNMKKYLKCGYFCRTF